MKTLLCVVAFCVIAPSQGPGSAPQAPPSAALTNEGILEMQSSGLSAEVILAKIKTSVCAFDTAPPALAQLKAGGVPEAVILAMIGVQPPSEAGTTAPVDPSPKSKAKLHFYRERAFVALLRKMPIYIDEVKVADLVNGREFSMLAEPGKHVFRCLTKAEAIQADIEQGGEYYFRAELIQGFTKNHWHVVQVAKQQGEADVRSLKPLDLNDISPAARMPR
jgi:hypothetical protein